MADKWFTYISELAKLAQAEVTKSSEHWQRFLTTASRFYKSYSFDDQLLIYMQRPDATACADMETWNGKMRRWVNAGSKAIGLIRKGTGGRPYIQNVHDVSDTHRVRGGKDPWLWNMEADYHGPVAERLAKAFNLPGTGSLGDTVMETAAFVVEESYGEYLRDLHYEVEDSFLEELDEQNVDLIFRDTLKASVQYAALTRCGLDASLYLDREDLGGVINFNNVGTLACLGTVTAEASRVILMEVGEAVRLAQLEQARNGQKGLAKGPEIAYNESRNFNTLKHERSMDYEQTDLHQPERIPDTQPYDGQPGGGGGNADPVRESQGEIFNGTPESPLHQPAFKGNLMEPLDGNRPDGQPAGGQPGNGTGGQGGRDGEAEGGESNGLGGADEQYPSESRGSGDGGVDLQLTNEREREKSEAAGKKPAVSASVGRSVELEGPFSDTPYTQLSLFPTVEEQIERIAQAEGEKPVPAVYATDVVSEKAVERILSAGTNDPVGALRIYTQYQAGVEAGEMAVSLRQEFGRGGRGFTVDGVSYALWFDENGIALNSGKSARYDKESLRLSWTEAEARIRRLVETGIYLSPERAAKTWDNEAHELAANLWYLRQDFGEPAHDLGLLPLVSQVYEERGGFPEATKKLETMLQSPEKTAALVGEVKELCAAYAQNPEILRFHFHRPLMVLKRLERLQADVKIFPLTKGFQEERPSFITEDEIDEAVAPGGSYSDSKLATYVFFQNHTDRKERQEYLKESFGTGGNGSFIRDTWHDAKGFQLTRTFETPYAKTFLNWNQVERRIHKLMETGRFLTPSDQARFPEYEKFILSRDVNAFFYYGAKEQRPYEENGQGHGWETVRKLIDNPAQVDTLLSVMRDGLQSMAPGQRGYEVCVNAYDSLSAYKDGTFSLLRHPGAMPEKEGKESAIESGKKRPSISREKQLQDAAKSAINRLKSQSRKKVKEEKPVQLRFDFSGGTVSMEKEAVMEPPREPEGNLSSLRDLYHQYQPLVLSQVFKDSAFFNALQNSDEQNLLLECDAAVRRAVLAIGEVELTKAYFDTPQFHDRLHREIRAQAKKPLSLNLKQLSETSLPEERAKSEESPGLEELEAAEEPGPAGETCLIPHIGPYNALKEAHPEELVGIQNGGYCLFYGEDAKAAFEAMPVSWLLPADLPGMGQVTVAGIREGWQEAADRLQAAGQRAVFFQDNGENYTALGRTLIVKEPDRTDMPTLLQEPETPARGGLPEGEKQPRPEPNMVPLTEEYLRLKAEYPGHVVGVRVDGLYLFYGKDAENAANALGKKAITRDIPGLGKTLVTGSRTSWQAQGEKLLAHGNSALFARPEGNTYAIEQELDNSHYLPIGLSVTDQGRTFTIDSVDYDFGTVSLRDETFGSQTGFPIFRNEPVAYVRELVKKALGQELEAKPVPGLTQNLTRQESETLKPEPLEPETLEPGVLEPRPLEPEPPAPGLLEPGALEQEPLAPESFEPGTLEPKPTPEIPPAPPQGQNFRITDLNLGVGGPKAKYQANVAAIRLLKELEAAGRNATPEEQDTLSRYVGWGGIPQAFDAADEKWAGEYEELKGLLTQPEYESARSSTLNAHYTAPVITQGIYKAVEQMGLNPKTLLEPSMGTGNFLGMLPDSMKDTALYGVELDAITGRIAKQLYPQAHITVEGFERVHFADNKFDLAVGNVPFGSYRLADPRYDKEHFFIHDYFFAKTIDKLRPGGVLAFITSNGVSGGTFDKRDSHAREYMARRCELLGAVRLPNNAFLANAGTDITTDILFLQKRENPRQPGEPLPEWVETDLLLKEKHTNSKGEERYNTVTINKYFQNHPEMALGNLEVVSGPFGPQLVCTPIEGKSLSEQLEQVIPRIVSQYRPIEPETQALTEREAEPELFPAPAEVRNFSYTEKEGRLYYKEDDSLLPVSVPVATEERIRGMMGLRDITRRLIEAQMDSGLEGQIPSLQQNLNAAYDRFTSKYGLLNSTGNKRAFEQDSSYCLLCSLEVLDEDRKLERKADMFSKRTINQGRRIDHVDTPTEALAVSIGEHAGVDLPFMARLLDRPGQEEAIAKELSGVIFKNPEKSYNDPLSGWETADEYLSGNVRKKLAAAKAAAERDPVYKENVAILEQSQPRDLSAAEIDVRIGATWIAPEYYTQFIYELLKTPNYLRGDTIAARYSSATGEWNVSGKTRDSANNTLAYVTYGTKRKNAYAIMEDSLNLRDCRVYDTIYEPDGTKRQVLNTEETMLAQQKQEMVREAFKSWVWKDPQRREALCRKYNEVFNSIKPREYNGSHIRFTGMTPEIHLRPHQKNAVARMLYGGNSLLAHCVGAGKTFEIIAAAMEGKRLGLCQKNLVVVPNHLTEQWGADFLRLYPGANVLVATKKDFEPQNRKKFCSRIATGDYDAVVIGHSQFEKIPLSPERQKEILQEQINQVIAGIVEAKEQNGERYTIKQLEKSRKNLEAKLEKLNDQSRKDDVVTFEELGVDKLFVDEAHGFKNLFLTTKMRNVAGIGQSEAQKSSDMFAKCRYLDSITGGKGVVFATGTPVSNSMVELYTMMRYLQYDLLKSTGLEHFDSWAAAFGETVTALELAPEGGGFRAKTRFAKFFNLPELMAMWKESADIQTADMLKLPVPESENLTVVTKPSEFQRELVAELGERAEDVRNRLVEPRQDNMLKITSDGRKLALDQRLAYPELPDDPESKVNACVKNVLEVWHNTRPQKGAQLVFCDLSTPHGDGSFNVYDDIKQKLMAQGVPPEQVSFIHDAKTEAQKAELFSKVRKGQVRVLLGSTSKMGAGTNVQTRLAALHHLDCPWRPADIEQREGRILRQGNQFQSVKIFKYVTEGTFDAYNWGLIENKQKFIGQLMSGKNPSRSCEDVDEAALSYAEVKALASGDPRIMEKTDLDGQVTKLKLLKANHESQRYALEDKLIQFFPQAIKREREMIDDLEKDLAHLEANTPAGKEDFSMTVLGTTYTEKKEAGQALIDAFGSLKDLEDRVDLGQYRGFSMTLWVSNTGIHPKLQITLKHKRSHTIEPGNDPFGNLTRIGNALDGIRENLTQHKEELANLLQQTEEAKVEVKRPFPQEEELAEKSKRLSVLNVALNMGGKSKPKDKERQAHDGKTSIKRLLRRMGVESAASASAPAPKTGKDMEVTIS